MDFLSVHLLVGYAFFNLFLCFLKSSKFFMRRLTHKTSQVLTSVGWILKNDLDMQLALGQGMNNLLTRLFENRVETRPAYYAVSRYPTKTYWSIGHFDAKWYSTFSLPCKICSFHPTQLFLNHKPFFHFLLRSFANGSSSLSMIVVATQICKRTYHRHGTSDLAFGLNSFCNKSIVSWLRNLNFCAVLVTWMEVS